MIDAEEEAAYECHKADNGLFRLVDTLTAEPDVSLSVAAIFEKLKKESWLRFLQPESPSGHML